MPVFNLVKFAILVLLMFYLSARCASQEARYAALSQIETGDNDFALGRSGEVGRYAMMPAFWRANTSLPLSSARNPLIAFAVAKLEQDRRVAAFVFRHRRQPTDREWSLLWHRPARVLHPTALELDYAVRFENLCKHPPVLTSSKIEPPAVETTRRAEPMNTPTR